MPIMRTYQCPDCEGYFEHLHLHSGEAPPPNCELCGADMRGTPPELSAPHIARSIGKVADNVYRAMEESSAHRAEMAAEAMGESASEFNAMKVTNIRDDARAGESSVVTANNAVSQFMGQNRIGGHMPRETAAEYAQATRTGPYAGAGLAAVRQVTQNHASLAPRVVRAGNLG